MCSCDSRLAHNLQKHFFLHLSNIGVTVITMVQICVGVNLLAPELFF